MIGLQEYVGRKVKGMLGELKSSGEIRKLEKFLKLAENKGINCHNYRADASKMERKYVRKLMKVDC